MIASSYVLVFLKKASTCSSRLQLRTLFANANISARMHISNFLENCILHKNLLLGSKIHCYIIVSGFSNDSFLSTKLISLYSDCGNIPMALTVFSFFPITNVYLLNSLIRGYSSNGLHQEAITFFNKNRREGLLPDSYSFSCVLKACASLADLWQGKQLHQLAVQSGFEPDIFVSNSLIFMYSKCGSLEDVVLLFERIPRQDVVSWNTIVSAYALNGFVLEAAKKVSEMIRSGMRVDQVTIISILNFNPVSDIIVREVHGYVLRKGHQSILRIHNALISAYGKCGMVKEARRVFDCLDSKDRVSWNSLIACYAQNGLFKESLQLLREMKVCRLDLDVVTYCGIISSLAQSCHSNEAMVVFMDLMNAGIKPDVVLIASVLPAISGIFCLNYCKEIHGYSF
ncbi:hypothetical protein HPP92_000538 [Vanilla planifolia]|uniref:Pentatricopeptide repeat-containing protein n=1 Tax=Vanilla planifolia TaxID=51239 RepID=A0A835S2F9_VANPL|nr:hypothetical protein HPP92_000578 [Vanilla planifolia]KAG0500466.1 hypothetical protein HPP92_000538 [Vanilla planifolia]